VNEAEDRYEQDLAAYLLGALEEHEARELEQHLEGCAHCRAERERLRLAADALPRSVLQVAPPPSLKESLMAEVEPESPAVSRPRARRRLRELLPDLGGMRPTLAWVSAAFLLAVGIATGWGITQLGGSEDSRVIRAQVDERRIPSGSASLVIPEEGKDGAILRVNGMPSLVDNGVYQVWLERDGEVISQGLFSVSENGRGSAAVSDRLTDADAVLVTREAAGGARAPSEQPILRVKL
jgi:anti-sigma-K factor RskA